jgi:ABC-type multidrug transport system fused ATPase/permease subunit
MTTGRLLWAFFWYQRWRYSLVGALACVEAALLLAPAYIARAVFDTLSGRPSIPGGIYALSLLLVTLALARMGAGIAKNATGATATFAAKALLRVNLLCRILARPGAQALADSSGEATSRFRDDADLAEITLRTTIETLAQAVYAAAALATMLYTIVISPYSWCFRSLPSSSRHSARARGSRSSVRRVAPPQDRPSAPSARCSMPCWP